MKKLIFPIVCCFISVTVSAQLIKPKAETQKKQSELDWFNCSFDQDSVYGAEVNKAYDYLKANKKKAKKRPVVALIGTGMDVEHEDLKHAIWINPKEKSNQKDDDKNGLIDDINGWNFLGGKDGSVMETLTREGEREFIRLKDKYAGYVFDGKKYYKAINDKLTEVPAPENLQEYYYFQHKVTPENGGLKLNLECIRPDVEIRYTIDGSEPVANSSVYSDSLIVTGTQLIKCATFAEGVQMGKTLVLPITWNKATAKTILGNKQNEMLMLNGVCGSLKQTDFEWCCWDKNDLISFTIDLQQKEKMNTFTIGCITNYGMGVHKPKSIRIAVSDDNKSYRDVTGLNYTPEEIFREGTYIEDLSMDMKGTEARYIRVTVNGAGECPADHVRPGQESRVYFDEIIIE